MTSKILPELLKKHQYRLAGKHAAVKICHYTKESLRGKNFCYKQKFYGIQSHRCLQMTPIVDKCTQNCTFCWRPMDYTQKNLDFSKAEFDEPKEIIDKLINEHKKLLIGFKGYKDINRKKLEEAFEPKHAAISLAGEPTLYPKLGELIEGFHKKGMTTFLVTNGTNPEAIKQLIANSQEPTQLYISLCAPNKNLYKKIARPLVKNSWEKIQESLKLMQKLKCRTVIRLTLTKSALIEPEGYAKLINAAKPQFIEVKAYMHVGFSQKRLPQSQMPEHAEILDFAKKIAGTNNYKFADEKVDSRVTLLAKAGIGESKLKFN